MKKEEMSDYDQIKASARAKASNACLKISAVFGIGLVAVSVLLSRPLMSYFAREMCYNMHGSSSYWPNPIRGLWGSAWTTYQCEWMGHWGFNWYEVFSFLTNSWQAILTSLGSITGGYALFRQLNGANQANQGQGAPLRDSLNQEQFNTLMQAIRTGYLPMHEESKTRHAQKVSSPREPLENQVVDPDSDSPLRLG